MKKLFATVVIFVIVFSNIGYATALEPISDVTALKNCIKAEGQGPAESTPKEDATVSVIVELSDGALLDAPKAQQLGAKSYLQSSEAKTKKTNIESKQDTAKRAIREIDGDAEFKYSYANVINGFSVRTKMKHIDEISKLPGVKNVYEDTLYRTPDVKMVTSPALVFPESGAGPAGLKGEKTMVAVVDTGVDVNHEAMALSDEGNVKLSKAQVTKILDENELQAEKSKAGLKADDVYKNPKFPFCFDYADSDENPEAVKSQHGVHVAGTVGANSTAARAAGKTLKTPYPFDGIAPETQIIGMKVFPDADSSAGTTITLAAVEDAITLGVDAINLSLGSTAGFTFIEGEHLKKYEYEYSFEKARNAGILVAVACGNEYRTGDGRDNTYESENPITSNPDDGVVGDPATKKHATAVASIDNTKRIYPYFRVGNKEIENFFETLYPDGYKGEFISAIENLIGSDQNGMGYVRCGYGLVEGDAKEFPDRNDFKGKEAQLKGKIAVVERGFSSFSKKIANAKKSGAVACIIIGSTDEGFYADCQNADPNEMLPSIYIMKKDGELFPQDGTEGVVAKKSLVKQTEYASGTSMSSFSSWGCTPDLKLKPEITAPGGAIYSTVTGGYESMGGTSMATPHVAGGMALMKQHALKKAELSSLKGADLTKTLEAILMSTATVLRDDKSKFPHSPRVQGAGLMNLNAAVKDTVYLMNDKTEKAKVELYDFTGKSKQFKFKVVNLSPDVKDYELSADVLIQKFIKSKGNTFTDTAMNKLAKSSITFEGSGVSGNTVSVAGKTTTEITATLSLDQSELAEQKTVFKNGFFIEGYVYLTSKDNSYTTLSLPYMGFYGDWKKVPMFDEIAYDTDIKESGKVPFFGKTKAMSDFGKEKSVLMGVDSSKERINGSKYVAFSPKDRNGYFDFACVNADTFRNAKYIDVKVVDGGGNDVKTENFGRSPDKITAQSGHMEYISKSYYSADVGSVIPGISVDWDGTDDAGKIVADGQYYMTFKGKPDYDGASEQAFRFPVIVDNTKPTVKAYYDERKKEVTLDVSDNYFMDTLVIDLPTAKGENAHVEFLRFEKSKKITIPAATFADPTKIPGAKVSLMDSAANEGVGTIEAAKDEAKDIPKEITDGLSAYRGTYDAAPHALVTSANDLKAAGIKAECSTDSGKTYSEGFAEAKDAGTYDVKVKLSGDGYNAKEIELKSEIAKAPLKIDSAEVSDKSFDDTTAATVSKVKISPDFASELVEGTDYSVSAKFEDKGAGKDKKVTVAVVLLSEKAEKNYLPPADIVVKADITAISVPQELIDKIKGLNTVYNGKENETVSNVDALESAGFTMRYSTDNGKTYTTKIPTVSDVTEGKVLLEITKQGYETRLVEIHVSVKPLQIDIDGYTIEEKFYDGTNKAVIKKIKLSPAPASELVLGVDYEISATYENADAGKDKPIKIKVSLLSERAKKNFLAPKEIATIGTIKCTIPSGVSTGDGNDIMLWIAAQILAVAGCGMIVGSKAKRARIAAGK